MSEQDIDDLEELRKELGLHTDGNKIKQGIALEHLIKAYKELKEIEENHRKENGELRERVKELEEEIMQKDLEIIGAEEYTKASMGEIIEHYYTANEKCIPVSLAKEKIEELKSIINKYEKQIENDEETDLSYEEIRNYACKIEVLQELLEKRK